MNNLPDELYTVDSIVALERAAIEQFDTPAYELMKRAGSAVFQLIQSRFSQCRKILVLCGAGNNAGDGYVVARLVHDAGYDVSVISLIDPEKLHGAAEQAYHEWLEVAQNTQADAAALDSAELIVDALLGTGLKRNLDTVWSDWISAINHTRSNRNIQVIAVDIPSGLYADTGTVSNATAIRADITMTFIGLKQGLFTADAGDYCGQVQLDTLGLSEEVFSLVKPDAYLLHGFDTGSLEPRDHSSNKGHFGHVLIVGGNQHMPGALILSASAALRTGAGKVTVLTIAEHIDVIASAVPEAMILSCDGKDSLEDLLNPAFMAGISHIAIGMGLGRDQWAIQVLQYCLSLKKPMLIDADALNLVAEHEIQLTQPVVITPHPGEAGRLIHMDIQHDRYSAVRKLHALLSDGSVVVLKGSGSLVYDGNAIKVCALGNPAMASAGMGDVLSGMVAGLLAQGLSMKCSAELAVCLHASIADELADGHTRGLLASDIVHAIGKKLP